MMLALRFWNFNVINRVLTLLQRDLDYSLFDTFKKKKISSWHCQEEQ